MKNEKNSVKSDSESDTRKNKSGKKVVSSKYDGYSDDDYNNKNDKIMRAHKQVNIPTDSVQVYKCDIQFNRDSLERQRSRAKDLRKLIELDKKSFNLFELNPTKMSTIYSANAKHVLKFWS